MKLLYLCRTGSRAYGTAVADSDEDTRGFCLAAPAVYLGFVEKFEQQETKDPDRVIYEVRKFFRLASGCNPNTLEQLYVEPEDRLVVTPAGQRVLDARDFFLSRQAHKTFTGYAWAQIQRLSNKGRDDKHAMHIVRLLRMGGEILRGDGVIVRRPDAAELLRIRAGDYSTDELIAEARRQIADLDALVDRSPLPPTPDLRELDELCQSIVRSAF